MSVAITQASDRISRTSSSPDLDAGFTFTGWAYLISDLNANQTVIRWYSGGSTILTFATDVDGTTPNLFTANGSVTAVDNFVVGQWLFVAVTQTGTSTILYTSTSVGGTLHSSSGSNGLTGTADGFTLGGRSTSDASEWGNFREAQFRQWSAVLTSIEIAAERDSSTPVRTSNLWADYPLSTASDLTDHSGNGRNLTAGSTGPTTAGDPPNVNNQTIIVPLLSVGSTVFSPGVNPGPVGVQVPLISTSSTVFGPGATQTQQILVPLLTTSSSVFSPGVISLLQILTLSLLTAPSNIFAPSVSGGEAPKAMASIADTARVNMLANRSLTEPRRETNADLMALVLNDGAQVLVPKTNASVGTHLLRYMMSLRN